MINNFSCIRQKANINLYNDPTYSIGIIQSVVIFPMIHKGINDFEAFSADQQIAEGLKKKNPFLKIINAENAKKLIHKYNLGMEWNTFLLNYVKFGRPDYAILSDIRKKIPIDAIIQGEIVEVSQEDGEYLHHTAKTLVSLKYSIFDLRRGKLVWEGSSNGLNENEITFESAPPIEDALDPAVEIIIEWLPTL